MENDVEKIKQAKKAHEISVEMEERMRLFANLIIDRIFEDKRNNVVKFRSIPKLKQSNAIK